MITIWPYLRLSVGFQGHFQWTSEARDGCLHFSAILAAAQGSHLPIIQKSSHWISCRLPLFLSFSPGSTQLLNNPPVTVTWQQGQIELGMEVVYKKQIEIAYFMSTIVYWYPQPPQGCTGIYTGLIYSHAVWYHIGISDCQASYMLEKESFLESKNHLEALSWSRHCGLSIIILN